MSASSLITDGFGSFGDVADVVCLGLDIGAVVAAETLGRDGLGGDDVPTRHHKRDRIEIWETRKKAVDAPVRATVKVPTKPAHINVSEVVRARRQLTEQERNEAQRLAELLLHKPANAAEPDSSAPQIFVKPRKAINLPRFVDPIEDDDEDIFLLM